MHTHMHVCECSHPHTCTQMLVCVCTHFLFKSSTLNRSINCSICASVPLGDRKFSKDSLEKEWRETGRGSRHCRKDEGVEGILQLGGRKQETVIS